MSECHEQYKIAIIKNLINRSKHISLLKTIFSKLKNIKQFLINNVFSSHIVDEQIKRAIKNINSNCNKKEKDTTLNNIWINKVF